MKKTIFLLGCVALLLSGCSSNEDQLPNSVTDSALKAKENSVSGKVVTGWDVFTDIPEGIREKARIAWGSDTPPAIIIAFTSDNVNLEEGWGFDIIDTPDPTCMIAGYQDQNQFHTLKTENGFVFLEEGDICGEGVYSLDNTQGGWYDHVCGPTGIWQFTYSGEPIFMLTKYWCE
ncbi:hypothetical protein [Flavobacterium sp. '19STA2R22 D10 B1']|uniref:hypothetical protein n=1 Tax=Flavobacterium aerium TaxID=3037261 RepID=UPI00278C860C|nr:hypothetical protein [Flavobacterium sp. '19STA2R22 D10 B1']